MPQTDRRSFLAASAALAAFPAFTAAPAKTGMGLVVHSYAVRNRKPTVEYPSLEVPLALLEHAASIGAGGAQTRIRVGKDDPAKLKATAERLDLFLEASVTLPKDEADAERFDVELKAAKAAGDGEPIVPLHGAIVGLRDGNGRHGAIRTLVFADESMGVGQHLTSGGGVK